MAALLWGCSIEPQSDTAEECFGLACAEASIDGDESRDQELDNAAASPSSAGDELLNALCGRGSCHPDHSQVCELPMEDSAPAESASPEPSLDPDAGLSASGSGASPAGGGAADAGADGGIAVQDGGVDSPGASDASVPQLPPVVSESDAGEPIGACQIQLDSEGEVQRSCGVSGGGLLGSPCTRVSDCRPGYGCVGPEQQGRCLPYCCGGAESCSAGSFCDPRALRVPAMPSNEAPLVPVCVPADHCELGAPYPCEGEACDCAEGTACMVVGDDGTTSCRVPGEGLVGDSCPCAPGHMCSKGTNTCLKICTPDREQSDCPAGMCQTGLAFPDGFGVCVGTAER